MNAYEYHTNGIHTYCQPVKKWWLGRKSSGVPFGRVDDTNCPLAGSVEGLHAHDFDGPCPVCDE